MVERGTRRRRDPINTLDLRLDFEDLQLDRQQKKMLEAQTRLIRETGEQIMGALEDLQAAVTDIGAGQEEQATQLDKIAAQLADIQSGSVSASALGPIITALQEQGAAGHATAARIDALIEVEGEDGPVEPPVEPEPPVI